MKKRILIYILLLLFPVMVNAKVINDSYDENIYYNDLAGSVDQYLKDKIKGDYLDVISGITINREKKGINVYYTNDSIINNNIKDEVKLLFGSVYFNKVRYSYNYINNMKNIIHDELSKNALYVGSYYNIENNSITIEVNNIKEFNSNLLKNYNVNYSIVENNMLDYATFIHPGQKLMTKYIGYCTAGFRTKYNGEVGYVTAGHCTSGLNTINPQGIVKLYNNSGNSDYAFVKTNSSFSITNNLKYTNGTVSKLAVNNYCPNIYVNASVAKSGYATLYTTGTIYTTTYSVVLDGISYNNLVCAWMNSSNGDSGAPVFLPQSSGGVIVGILKGGNSDHTSTCFTNINNINQSLISGRY